MKIGIDARLIEETGVGRYIRNLIDQLSKIDTANEYVLFLRRKSFDAFELPNGRWHKVLADVPWHTLKEQVSMPGILLGQHLDLLHVPYFNVPIFYPKSYIVTIHDLTILHVHTGKATNLPVPLYWLKRVGYYGISLIGLSRAKHILAVSDVTKQEIMDHFAVNEGDITVTNEGIEKIFTVDSSQPAAGKKIMKEPYFLYVGNAYPHKNLEFLVHAFRQFKLSAPGDTKLVLVGSDDIFYTRLKDMVRTLGLADSVLFFGPANDDQLIQLYSNALAFVFPSLMEGFGLPGLEAMACGTPVVCSDIPVFHEIYQDAATYFQFDDIHDLVSHLNHSAHDKKGDTPSKEKRETLLKKYSWKRMAQQTQRVFGL